MITFVATCSGLLFFVLAMGLYAWRRPIPDALWRALFGGHAQVAIGVLSFGVGLFAWLWFTLVESPTVAVVFHISMFYGQAACYAIIATGLNYRATERVETVVNTT